MPGPPIPPPPPNTDWWMEKQTFLRNTGLLNSRQSTALQKRKQNHCGYLLKLISFVEIRDFTAAENIVYVLQETFFYHLDIIEQEHSRFVLHTCLVIQLLQIWNQVSEFSVSKCCLFRIWYERLFLQDTDYTGGFLTLFGVSATFWCF